MKNFDIFVWSSDYEDFRGEGVLARKFVSTFFFNSNLVLKILSNNGSYFLFKKKYFSIKKKNIKNNYYYKYIYLYYGILLIWYYHLKGKKVCYLNYLPLWNFFIFFLLPRSTILGPITGATFHKNIYSINSFIRKLILPIFFKISNYLIFKKFNKIIFSTDNLKKYIKKKNYKFCRFNFSTLLYEKRKKKIKKIDFLFYYRQHIMKSNLFHENIIKYLADNNYDIVVVGDKFIYPNVKNYINLPRKNLLNILDKVKYTLASDENFYNLFSIDCLSCHVKIFANNLVKPLNNFFSNKSFIFIDFTNFQEVTKRIVFTIKR